MGLHHHSSGCSVPQPVVVQSSPSAPKPPPKTGMPDPGNFKILRGKEIDRWVVVEVQYPDCTNYEGRKVLVYRDVTLAEVQKRDKLDPHFCEHRGCLSPFARFEPTENGWNAALLLCQVLY